MVEQLTLNQRVVGSNPTSPTIVPPILPCPASAMHVLAMMCEPLDLRAPTMFICALVKDAVVSGDKDV